MLKIHATVGRGFYTAILELEFNQALVTAPVKDKYPLREGVRVMPLADAIREFN